MMCAIFTGSSSKDGTYQNETIFYILMLTHLPCLNLIELNMYLENWSEKIPSHIPTIPISNTDTRMYVTTVLMIVTLMIDEINVYFTSPAALKHPP